MRPPALPASAQQGFIAGIRLRAIHSEILGRKENAMKKMSKVGGVFFSLALAGSCVAAPCAAWADDHESPASKGIPSAALSTSGYITGAATRAAMPAPEILGLASVEEAGQFVDTVNWYTWSTPKYILSASTYTNTPSPYLANLALSSLGLASTDATHLAAALNTGRNGNGAGPGAALATHGTDSSDDAVWALHPDVVIGTGNLTDSGNGYYYGLTGDNSYNPIGVPYSFSNYSGLIGTMTNIAAAADAADDADSSRTLRYGSATAIAQAYGNYIYGTMGLVQFNIDTNVVPRRTVALVQSVEQVDGVWTYNLMTSAESSAGDGTAASNRYLETTSNSGIKNINLATNYADTKEVVTAADLANVNLIMVGGQQGASGYASIMEAIEADNLVNKTYYVENNGANGASYGVVMNSVENAQNIGRILGCLYPEVVSQRDWMAYYYEKFYHVGTNNLATVMSGVLDGVRNWTVQDTSDEATAFDLSEWTVANSGYSAGKSATTVENQLKIGRSYFDRVTA